MKTIMTIRTGYEQINTIRFLACCYKHTASHVFKSHGTFLGLVAIMSNSFFNILHIKFKKQTKKIKSIQSMNKMLHQTKQNKAKQRHTAKDKSWVFLSTGTTRPVGEATATEIST